VATAKQAVSGLELAPTSERPTFITATDGYCRDVLPTKALGTARQQGLAVLFVALFGGNHPVPLNEIEPVQIRKYLRWRVSEAKRCALGKHPDQPVPDSLGHVCAIGRRCFPTSGTTRAVKA
jgi:hypothetical protein